MVLDWALLISVLLEHPPSRNIGFVNAPESIQLKAVEEDKDTKVTTYITTFARLVLSENHIELKASPGPADREPLVFSLAGDSGSIIFNGNTLLKGQMFGGFDDGSTTYFTPVEDLFNDIKFMTGATEVKFDHTTRTARYGIMTTRIVVPSH